MPRKQIAPTLDRLVKGNTIFEAEEPQAEREYRTLLAVARAAKGHIHSYKGTPENQCDISRALRRLERVSGSKL